jgi:hypothetical protein
MLVLSIATQCASVKCWDGSAWASTIEPWNIRGGPIATRTPDLCRVRGARNGLWQTCPERTADDSGGTRLETERRGIAENAASCGVADGETGSTNGRGRARENELPPKAEPCHEPNPEIRASRQRQGSPTPAGNASCVKHERLAGPNRAVCEAPVSGGTSPPCSPADERRYSPCQPGAAPPGRLPAQ